MLQHGSKTPGAVTDTASNAVATRVAKAVQRALGLNVELLERAAERIRAVFSRRLAVLRSVPRHPTRLRAL